MSASSVAGSGNRAASFDCSARRSSSPRARMVGNGVAPVRKTRMSRHASGRLNSGPVRCSRDRGGGPWQSTPMVWARRPLASHRSRNGMQLRRPRQRLPLVREEDVAHRAECRRRDPESGVAARCAAVLLRPAEACGRVDLRQILGEETIALQPARGHGDEDAERPYPEKPKPGGVPVLALLSASVPVGKSTSSTDL